MNNKHSIQIKTLLVICCLMAQNTVFAQVETKPQSSGPTEFSGFSAMPVSAKRTSRGATIVLEDLLPFAGGAIKTFEFQTQYKKVFLGNDFFDVASKAKSCDSLQRKIGKVKSHFIPVADGQFFKHSLFHKIEELSGFYRFQNSKNLPGILPNVDVWIKMEAYRHAKSKEVNCLVVKFLIPEDVNGKIENRAYAMRNDGILVSIPSDTELDFSLKMDFAQYCIFPLNDPNETTHLIGKDFTILGSFARQKQCENMKGLLFPTVRNGTANGCVFFRKQEAEMAPNF